MLFNSIEFAFFLPLVFVLYWLFKGRLKTQNFIIVVSSYVFYGWWDWRFLSLIIISTVVDFSIGVYLNKTKKEKRRKTLLIMSIILNLGILGFFKYYNFFIDNISDAFMFFGQPINIQSLSVILPVGISFYTFQTMSYTIDVYRKKMDAQTDLMAFSAFVCFFPQLVAGPIERATNLLPQFSKKRQFVYANAVDGLRQALWGLFKKVVIADNCAEIANQIFNNSDQYSGSTLLIGAIFFSFQIYGDFSGYSDIAIGISRLFGFDLKRNFAFPYFSRDIGEFWRRWHISLSTWFRDYLYIPLGGSKGNTWQKIRNTFIIFIVSGFWHGANWTFIFWGLLNALYFIPLMLLNKNRSNKDSVVAEGKALPSLKEFTSILSTFSITVLAWIFFRSENITHAFSYISEIFSSSIIQPITYFDNIWTTTILLLIFIIIEWSGRDGEYAISKTGKNWPRWLRWFFYYTIIATLFLLKGESQDFIYFQF